MRLAIVAVFSLLVTLGAAAAADAAMLLRIYVEPLTPTAGFPARVSIVTLAPMSRHCAWDPAASHQPNAIWYTSSPTGELELRMVAEGRDEKRVPVPLVRRKEDQAWWDGTVVFPEAGLWTLRVVYPTWSDEECGGARRVVEVRERSLPTTSTEGREPSALAASLLVGTAIALLLIALRRAPRARLSGTSSG